MTETYNNDLADQGVFMCMLKSEDFLIELIKIIEAKSGTNLAIPTLRDFIM